MGFIDTILDNLRSRLIDIHVHLYQYIYVISFCYAFIAALIKRFIDIAEKTKQIDNKAIDQIWKGALEKETIPRRFGPGRLLRGPLIEIS